ncbi:MAG: DUF502 domain-containing protein [Candidatus Zixiibacteriota bacterium]
MSIVNRILHTIRVHFVSGVLVVVPIILTYIVLKFLFEAIDGILQPILFKVLGYYVYGLGVITTLLLIILAGILTRNFIGARLYGVGEKVLIKMPIIRPVYSAAKQLLEAVTMPSMNSFKEVALVEYPRKGAWAVGFISNRVSCYIDGTAKMCAAVFLPSTPTPISGMVVLFPDDEVIPVDMSIEEGVKFIVSGGVASPETLKPKRSAGHNNDQGVLGETR